MIEQLEARLQYANLSGQVFHDTDNSQSFDKSEEAFNDWQVFIDSNANGSLDAGEPTTTTDAEGNYTFENVDRGTYLVGVVPPQSDYLQTTPGKNGTIESGFHINVQFSTSASAAMRRAFADAAARWESIITGIRLAGGGIVGNTLNIIAAVRPIDGVGAILGGAFDPVVDPKTGLSIAGKMEFDSADLKQLVADNQLEDVVLHEMGHTLGVGTLWTAKHVTAGNLGHNPRYIGTNAVANFNKLFRTTNLSIPIENQGFEGGGTRGAHWREATMTEELMTGFISAPGVENPLSTITIGQFADLGYAVNYKGADAWIPSRHETTKTVATDFGGVAFERSVQVGLHDVVSDIDFGYRINAGPVIKQFSITPQPVASGDLVTLTAGKILDFGGDPIQGVSFWRESNGIPGLQSGSDTYIASKTEAKRHVFSVQTDTDGLTLGDQVYYAVATDDLGAAGRRTGTVTIVSTTVPDRPTDLAVVRRSATSATFSFVDNLNSGILGYRVQVATRSSFGVGSIVDTFNISADDRQATIFDLVPGTRYWVHLRAYNPSGASPYSESISFETL